MASSSPQAGYTRLPRTSEETERKDQVVDTSKNSTGITVPFSIILRLLATTFAIVAIPTIVAGDFRYWYGYHSASRGLIAFPLVFLCSSSSAHIFAGFYYAFTSLVHVEWKGPQWQGPSQLSYGRARVTKKSIVRWITAADLSAAVLMVISITVCSVSSWLTPTSIAGVVFASLTAATHGLLAITHADRYRLTLTYHPNTDKATSGLVKSPFTYHDLEDASEQQPLTSTMEV